MTNNLPDTTDKKMNKEDIKKIYEAPQFKLLVSGTINTGTTSNVAENSGGYLTGNS